MLSYKEYRRTKQNNNNKKSLIFEDIDHFFNSWASEVTGFIICPKNTEKLINFCEDSVTSDSKWKTIQEHRMLKQLPMIFREALEEECAQARLFINEAKYQIKILLKEADGDAWAQLHTRDQQTAKNIEKEVENIFQQLKTDILNQYGTNRGVEPTQAGSTYSPTGQPQKPGLWGRAKNWLKGMWHGATGGDPNLRKFALSKGYASDPRYQHDPHAWKDPKKHSEFFPNQAESEFADLANFLKEGFEEASATFNNIFLKHKHDLIDLIARYALRTFGDKVTVQSDAPETEAPSHTKDRIKVSPDDLVNDKPDEPATDEPPIDKPATATDEPDKPDEPDKLKLNTNNFTPLTLARSIKEQQPNGTITLRNKGNEYTFTSEQQSEDEKYVKFVNDDVEISIKTSRWEKAKSLEPKVVKPTIIEPETEPESTETEPEIKTTITDPEDEEEHDDDDDETIRRQSDTDKLEPFTRERDAEEMATSGKSPEDKMNDRILAMLNADPNVFDNIPPEILTDPAKFKEIFPEEGEEKEQPKEKEKLSLKKLTIDEIIEQEPSKINRDNFKNLSVKNGKLIFKYHNKDHEVGTHYDDEDKLVYFYFPSAIKGRYTAKYMSKDKYEKIVGEDSDLLSLVEEKPKTPEVSEKPEKSEKPELNVSPNSVDYDDEHGQRMEDLLDSL